MVDERAQGLFFYNTPGGKLVPPTHAKEIITCLLVGLLGYGAQISLTYGLRSAKAAPAIATSYLSVVWGVLAGYFLFKEVCAPSVVACKMLTYLQVGLMGSLPWRLTA